MCSWNIETKILRFQYLKALQNTLNILYQITYSTFHYKNLYLIIIISLLDLRRGNKKNNTKTIYQIKILIIIIIFSYGIYLYLVVSPNQLASRSTINDTQVTQCIINDSVLDSWAINSDARIKCS